jgi:large subunit ribosomal protein L4
MAIVSYTKSGNKATSTVRLDKSIFGLKVENHELIKQAYVAYLANGRQNLATTLLRGQVRGGGRKPWRQKGTGRARFGSIRNPIWRGGGIVFGPQGSENYSNKLNTKSKRIAIRQALSLAASEGKISIIESIDWKDGKVAPIHKLLDKIGVKGSTLIVIDNISDLSQRSTNNIPDVKVVQAKYLNVFDLLNADTVIICKDAIAMITDWLGDSKVAASENKQ